jgi:hypothetical protein
VQVVEPDPGDPLPTSGEVAEVVAGNVDTIVPVTESWMVVVPSSDD